MWLIYNFDDELVYISDVQCDYIKKCLKYYREKKNIDFFRQSKRYYETDKFGKFCYLKLKTKHYYIYYYFIHKK